jgi:UDP-N-acetylglucosamine 2-epimerase (non-hydrolysing)
LPACAAHHDIMTRHHILIIAGTRPEVIKMAPVIRALERRADRFTPTLVTTGQHRELLDQVMAGFGLKPQIDLELMEPAQSLARLTSRALVALSELFKQQHPDAVLIQGDTTTAMAAAMAAFYQGICIGHVEAGLRSFNRRSPFPEEMNRRIAGCVADLHFAPTERARRNLFNEGVAAESIFVTGNTIVDALNSLALADDFDDEQLAQINFGKRRVLLVTAHRRESFGEPLRAICRALAAIVREFDDVEIIYPVHLNPEVRTLVYAEIGSLRGIHLISPTSYSDLLRLLRRCHFVLTDSGGIQEEAPSFHKPVLVLRDVTERQELIEAKAGRLVGTDTGRILEEARRLLSDAEAYAVMSHVDNPFGDGRAAERIADILADRL